MPLRGLGKVKRKVITRSVWVLALAIIVYAALVIWSDSRKNIATLQAFPWVQMPLILVCVTVNFLLRELKWDYFRRAAGIAVPRSGSFLVFFSGYSMCISPGRVGEIIKPFMYKEYFGQKMRRTIPLVLCERASDLLGMIVLAAGAAGYFLAGRVQGADAGGLGTGLVLGLLVLSAVFMAAVIWLGRQRRLIHAVLEWAGRRPRTRATVEKFKDLYDATYPLLTVRNLLVTTAMGSVSWFFECVAFDLILAGVGAPHTNLGQAAFVFCMSTIFGGLLFFLPGGLGGFESSMAVMLTYLGVPAHQATPAIFIVRLSTLFYGALLGFVFILITSVRYHKRIRWDAVEQAAQQSED